jgi:hypothetical protein
MNPSALPKRIAPLIARHSSSTNADANAKLAAFRQVVNARKSTKRFEPNQDVPEGVWRDILHMTLVSLSFQFYFETLIFSLYHLMSIAKLHNL